jgi:hypothetical protein
LAVAVATGIACAGPRLEGIGVSPPRAAERGARANASDADLSPVAGDFRAHLAKISDRFVSQGHASRFDAIVWANEAARTEPAGAGGWALPDGAIFVEEAIARGEADAGTLGLLVMEKRGAAWRFASVGADGKAVEDPRQASCVACHREAPQDFVFRPGP